MTRRPLSAPAGANLPAGPLTLPKLRDAAAGCTACDLWMRGTQTVFGEGAADADAFFVGEQPGNDEDLAGRPFVGPAGKLLDRALEAAGIDRSRVYVTNVVKHFKWVARGKRRIHQKPNSREIAACRPWLDMELTLVKPRVIVCLGATAAQAVIGTRLPGEPSARRDAPLAARTLRHRDRPPIVDPARPRRRDPPR